MRVLRVPCTTPQQAIDAKAALIGQQVDVAGVDDRFVLVPAGFSPIFVWDLAELLQSEGFGDDHELAQWASVAASARSEDDPHAIRAQARA